MIVQVRYCGDLYQRSLIGTARREMRRPGLAIYVSLVTGCPEMEMD